ncbi:MAG: Resolvase domain protein [Phycisphaerales bacterium]|nr:Resolvase domain protein [Phycisphaerales bacterium]
MLTLKEQGWGYKRIANYLNDVLKVPSPNAGQMRHNHGRSEVVEGWWSHSTVKDLLENRTILAIFEYDRRSEGKHRRLGPNGPRFLNDSDRNVKTKRPKVIRNDPSLIIQKALPFKPQFDPQRWEAIQEQTQLWGRAQRGIPRVSDPAKYPLACIVFDLTDGCGSVMYGRTNGRRALYTCGRYMKFGTGACDNNQVDAESLLQFTMGTLAELVDRLGVSEKLREKLLERARRDRGAGDDGSEKRRGDLAAKVHVMERQKQQAADNFLLASDPDLRLAAERRFAQLKTELEQAEAELEKLNSKKVQVRTPEDEAEKAMALLENVQRTIRDPAARAEIPHLVRRLGLRLGLRFVGVIKGKQRRVRRLAGGVMVFGDIPFDNGRSESEVNCRPGHSHLSIYCVGRHDASPVLATRPAKRHPEGSVSSTKVNRGDRI